LLRIKDAKKLFRVRVPVSASRVLVSGHCVGCSITRGIEKGVDIKVLSDWQGHSDGGTLILQNYSHVNRAHSDRMAQLI